MTLRKATLSGPKSSPAAMSLSASARPTRRTTSSPPAERTASATSVGMPSDSICALTCSRKAAGEIFDAIVRALCKASESDRAASGLAKDIEAAGFGRADAVRLLRKLADSLNRLHIGTLDSFIVSVIRAFPAELGVRGEFRVMDSEGAYAVNARRQVLRTIYNRVILIGENESVAKITKTFSLSVESVASIQLSVQGSDLGDYPLATYTKISEELQERLLALLLACQCASRR